MAADETQSHAILDKFQELGGNFVDSANVYELGDAEEIVGDWMRRFALCKKWSFVSPLGKNTSERSHLSARCG